MSEETGITIRLIDASEAEQAAFDRPPPNFNEPQAQRTPASQTDSAAASSPSASTPSPTANGAPIQPGQETSALRDSIMALVDRFSPEAFRDPIERLINALTLKGTDRGQQADTTVAPPISADQEQNIPPVAQVSPTPKREEPEPRTEVQPTAFQRVLARARGNAERIIRRVPGGSRALEAASKAGRFTQRSMRAIGRTRAGRRVGQFASSVASRIVPRFAQGAAAAARGAVAVGSTGAASGAAAGAAGGAAVAGTAVVPVVGAVVAAFAAATLAVKQFGDTLTDEARKLEDYSAPISLARARTQMNTELNMLDRANKVGSSLGRFEESKGMVSNQMEKLWTDILLILTKFEPVLTTLGAGAGLLLAEVRKGINSVEVATAAANLALAKLTVDPKDDKVAQDQLDALANERDAIMKEQLHILKTLAENWRDPKDRTIDPVLQAVLDADFTQQGQFRPRRQKNP